MESPRIGFALRRRSNAPYRVAPGSLSGLSGATTAPKNTHGGQSRFQSGRIRSAQHHPVNPPHPSEVNPHPLRQVLKAIAPPLARPYGIVGIGSFVHRTGNLLVGLLTPKQKRTVLNPDPRLRRCGYIPLPSPGLASRDLTEGKQRATEGGKSAPSLCSPGCIPQAPSTRGPLIGLLLLS